MTINGSKVMERKSSYVGMIEVKGKCERHLNVWKKMGLQKNSRRDTCSDRAANRSKHSEEITVSIMAGDDTGKSKLGYTDLPKEMIGVAFEQKATDGDDHDRGKERLGSARELVRECLLQQTATMTGTIGGGN
ncbi:MAG: hypothetical protein ACLTKE_08105 [Coprococcus sp.]